tara:strand:- start:1150 stop:2445 length:1296 start_codon:yes stop_codon:yes gene_type:complete
MLSVYHQRQMKLISSLQEHAFAVLFAGKKRLRNGDVHYPFRQSSSFLYLTGYTQADAWLILSSNPNQPQTVLFVSNPDPKQARWEGGALSKADILALTGVTEVHYLSDFERYLATISVLHKHCYLPFAEMSLTSQRDIQDQLAASKRKRSIGALGYADLSEILAKLRMIKDETEITIMRQAIHDSGEAHRQVIQSARANQFEYQLENTFQSYLRERGYTALAYPSIVAGGSNACILHYTDNNQRICSGDLVLIDAGVEKNGYAADITRTFPVNGQFSPVQQLVYQAVLSVQESVIQMIKPGCDFGQLNQCAITLICEFLIEVGLIRASLVEAIEKQLYLPYYFHSVGHWLGLDVHDVGPYKHHDDWIPFEPGMVLTIEPGLYFARDITDCPREYHGLGVRIEDDILVTQTGCEVLSSACPKQIDEIEELRH